MPSKSTHASLLGYAALVQDFALSCPPPRVVSKVSSSVRLVNRTLFENGCEEIVYPKSAYRPRTGLSGQLEYALKSEPLDLTVLAALFEKQPAREQLQAWLNAAPSSRYARTAGHLYEWLTGQTLHYKLPAGAPRVPILDEADYVTGPAISNPRFGVIHNLIGTRAMSPLVRRTPALKAFLASDLKTRITRTIAAIEPGLLERAVDYLYLAETKSSFAIEREIPSPDRSRRFGLLLERAGAPGPLNEEAMVGWQNEIIGVPLLMEHTYRNKQNWMSNSGSQYSVAYIPPAVANVDAMMQGISEITQAGVSGAVDPVIAAACASFGLVFVHPFLDGNGRLHRFLVHHILRQCGVTPAGVVLPLSVVLLKRQREYASVLQAYSGPRTRLLDYRLDPDTNTLEVKGPQPAWLYAYFDATRLCELVAECIDYALNEDLPAELLWLQSFDAAMGRINQWLEGEQSVLSLLVRLIAQNDGQLSKNKRGQFARYTDDEIARAEEIVRDAFSHSKSAEPADIGGPDGAAS
ncbi:MAG TPA: Fic family protein [Burkholderiaceae bacterium]|jgi:hypothetical protein|nr:Fic family protein [Burkholderiaceae bacterium]